MGMIVFLRLKRCIALNRISCRTRQRPGPKKTSNSRNPVLSISPPMTGTGKGNYYLELAREDYYLEGGEPPGNWFGSGADALGLKGVVQKNELRHLLNGFN